MVCLMVSSHHPLQVIGTSHVSYSEVDFQIHHPEYDRKFFPAILASSASSSTLASRAIGICAVDCYDNSLLRFQRFVSCIRSVFAITMVISWIISLAFALGNERIIIAGAWKWSLFALAQQQQNNYFPYNFRTIDNHVRRNWIIIFVAHKDINVYIRP